jgi:hypothetical protein
MIKAQVLSVLLLGLAACASQAKSVKPTAEQAQSEDRIVCHEETPVGKMISTKVCRRQADTDADRDEAQRVLGSTVNRPNAQPEQAKPYLPQPKGP